MPAENTGPDKDVVVGIAQTPSDSDTVGLASSSSSSLSSSSSSSSSFNVIGSLHSSLSSSSSLSGSQLNSLEDASIVTVNPTPATTIAATLINAAAAPAAAAVTIAAATATSTIANAGPSNLASDFTQQQQQQSAFPEAGAGNVIVVDSKQQRHSLPLSGTFIALPDTSCNDGGLTVVSGAKPGATFDCITLPSVVGAASSAANSAANSASVPTVSADVSNLVISSSSSSNRPMSKSTVTPTATYVVAVGPSDVAVGMPHANKTLLTAANPSSTAAATTKRSLIGTSNMSPVLAKFIITTPTGGATVATKNSSSSSLDHHLQQQAIPLQVQGQMMTLTSLVPGLTAVAGQEHGSSQAPSTPKTITITPQQTIMPSLTTGGPTQTVVTAMTPTGAGTPTKSTALQISKVPLSPAKTPTKITMIPVSMAKSPSSSAASSIVTMVTRTVAGSDRSVFTMTNNSATAVGGAVKSPSKLIIKQQPKPSCTQHLQLSMGNKPVQVVSYSQAPATLRQVAVSTPSIHQTVSENLHYVRLVTPNTQQAKTTTVSKSNPAVSPMVQAQPIVPATGSSTIQSQTTPSQVTITLPLPTSIPGVPKAASSHTSSNAPSVQRIILPATSQLSLRSSNTSSTPSSLVPNCGPGTTATLTQIRPNLPAAGGVAGGAGSPRPPTLAQILPSTALIPSGNTGQSYAITTLIPQNSKSPAVVNAQLKQDFIPIASNNPVVTANTLARNTINGTSIEATGARPRKPCNCTKSQCLKLYCDCFANGEFCHNCNCTNCANNLEHEEERSRAIKACLDRNPLAFHPKIGKGKGKDGDGDRRHNKGCNCKRSGCLKNYCECYEAKIMCSSICKCVGCKNFEESMERKTLMHLADAAEVRVQQQTAAKSKLSSQISSLPSRPPMFAATGEKLPYTFVTSDVVEETCVCLMARAEESEKLKLPTVVQERMVIEEFGRCLMRIIDSAHKTKVLTDVSL